MATTIKEIADYLGLSKPTVTSMVKSLDPGAEHTTEGKRGTLLIDDWLASAVADAFVKKGSIDADRMLQMQKAIEEKNSKPQKHEISGVKKVSLGMDQGAIKEAYERLLEAQENKARAEGECRELKARLEAAEADKNRIEMDNIDLKAKIAELEDKLEAERARYDELSAQYLSAVAAKPGLFRRLLSKFSSQKAE